jgi:hypothetical protein
MGYFFIFKFKNVFRMINQAHSREVESLKLKRDALKLEGTTFFV